MEMSWIKFQNRIGLVDIFGYQTPLQNGESTATLKTDVSGNSQNLLFYGTSRKCERGHSSLYYLLRANDYYQRYFSNGGPIRKRLTFQLYFKCHIHLKSRDGLTERHQVMLGQMLLEMFTSPVDFGKLKLKDWTAQ
jgi:hypothetical protein